MHMCVVLETELKGFTLSYNSIPWLFLNFETGFAMLRNCWPWSCDSSAPQRCVAPLGCGVPCRWGLGVVGGLQGTETCPWRGDHKTPTPTLLSLPRQKVSEWSHSAKHPHQDVLSQAQRKRQKPLKPTAKIGFVLSKLTLSVSSNWKKANIQSALLQESTLEKPKESQRNAYWKYAVGSHGSLKAEVLKTWTF